MYQRYLAKYQILILLILKSQNVDFFSIIIIVLLLLFTISTMATQSQSQVRSLRYVYELKGNKPCKAIYNINMFTINDELSFNGILETVLCQAEFMFT